jgi:hypothetical protein
MLLHLLSIEILKLQRNRSFWILSALFVLSVFGINNMFRVILSDASVPFKFFTFPEVWYNVAFISRFMLIIPGLIIIMHTCSEYTYRTHRQNVIDGLSRQQYITTKILFVAGMSLFSTILVFLNAFFIGLLSGSEISFREFQYIPYFFVQALSCMSLAFLFALLFKKSAITIGIFLSYVFIFKNIFEHYLNKLKLGDFVPLISSDYLSPMPTFMKTFINKEYQPEWLYLTVALAYILLFYGCCYYRYKKQDL